MKVLFDNNVLKNLSLFGMVHNIDYILLLEILVM
jgi:hypothetical protein